MSTEIDETNEWKASGCFKKDKLLALIDALKDTLQKYPEPIFSFKIYVKGQNIVPKRKAVPLDELWKTKDQEKTQP